MFQGGKMNKNLTFVIDEENLKKLIQHRKETGQTTVFLLNQLLKDFFKSKK